MIEVVGSVNGYISENYVKFVLVGIVALVGFFAIDYTNRYLKKISRSMGFDPTLKNFTRKSVTTFLWIVLITFILGNLGFNVIGFVAGLSIIGFIVGFATKDILSNFATGIFLLISRHYKVGEEVEISGVRGRVRDISLSSTILVSEDSKYIIIPNSKVWGGPIKNFSRIKK